jgi:hypothetical protein
MRRLVRSRPPGGLVTRRRSESRPGGLALEIIGRLAGLADRGPVPAGPVTRTRASQCRIGHLVCMTNFHVFFDGFGPIEGTRTRDAGRGRPPGPDSDGTCLDSRTRDANDSGGREDRRATARQHVPSGLASVPMTLALRSGAFARGPPSVHPGSTRMPDGADGPGSASRTGPVRHGVARSARTEHAPA